MTFQSYYKLPAAQTAIENCVAHNGSLIPIPGRDVMVQAWYQGGISVFDWTDPTHPMEIAYFDRGPMDATQARERAATGRRTGTTATSSSSEIARGLDMFELHAERVPVAERDRRGEDGAVRPLQRAGAAEARVAGELRRVARVPRPARALERALPQARITAIRDEMSRAQKMERRQRGAVLKQLALAVGTDAESAGDKAKVRMLSESLDRLADSIR